jgi:hypothetical protein
MHAELAFDTGVIVLGPEAGEEGGRSRSVLGGAARHGLSSFYEAFPPEEACRLTRRPEIHYTPEHGSWPDMAEIENSAMARQCLSRRISEKEVMEEETSAWSKQRNEEGAAADWRFRTEDARIKLRRLYPNIDG